MCDDIDDSGQNRHQTLLFSATVPSWVQNVAKKYLRPKMREDVDLVSEVNALKVDCSTACQLYIVNSAE